MFLIELASSIWEFILVKISIPRYKLVKVLVLLGVTLLPSLSSAVVLTAFWKSASNTATFTPSPSNNPTKFPATFPSSSLVSLGIIVFEDNWAL